MNHVFACASVSSRLVKFNVDCSALIPSITGLTISPFKGHISPLKGMIIGQSVGFSAKSSISSILLISASNNWNQEFHSSFLSAIFISLFLAFWNDKTNSASPIPQGSFSSGNAFTTTTGNGINDGCFFSSSVTGAILSRLPIVFLSLNKSA